MKRLAGRWMQVASGRFVRWLGMSPAVPLLESLRWSARQWLRILGRPGLLGVGILAVLPPFYFSAIAPAQERLDAARNSTFILREQIVQAGGSLDGSRRTPAGQLAEFYRIFPQERTSPQWLAKLAALADRNGLSLNEGEYQARADAGRLVRLQMVLPVKGEYRKIRRFLAALPAEIPSAALENIQFARRNVADPTVEARIKLALYLEQAS